MTETTGHEYDGIEEYDNPLPGWWKGVFVLTIVFAGAYAYWYHLGGPGKSIHEEFAAQWTSHQRWRADADRRVRLKVDEELLAAWSKDPTHVDAGRAAFKQTCAGCHQDDGRGNIGPNLTDDAQLHGHSRMDLYTTIHDGVTGTAMIAWSATLQTKDLAAIAAYVSSLRGHPVDGGKPPQGAAVAAFP